jgi:4'-phosphopantetheinyl transferase
MIGWPAGPSDPILADDEVHVWAVALAVGTQRLAELLELLDDEERGRAARFVHVPSRQQFIVARALLRILLGRYLNQPRSEVRFASSPQGKPLLADEPALHFNVTHTQDVALIAFTRLGPVGIDIERSRPYPGHRDMAERFFTPGEAAALRSLPIDSSDEAFFHVWTRKEAFLKAVGLGLSHGLERFEVSVPPDEPARILHIDGDVRAAERWSLSVLTPAAGYVGTLAIETREHRLICWSAK